MKEQKHDVLWKLQNTAYFSHSSTFLYLCLPLNAWVLRPRYSLRTQASQANDKSYSTKHHLQGFVWEQKHRQVSTRGFWFDFHVLEGRVIFTCRWFIIPVKIYFSGSHSVIWCFKCSYIHALPPEVSFIVIPPFCVGWMGKAYGEKQQSHFCGFFHTSTQYSELKKTRRKRELLKIRMVEIP